MKNNILIITTLVLLDLISKYLVSLFIPIDSTVNTNFLISLNPIHTYVGYSLDNQFFSILNFINNQQIIHFIQYTLAAIVISFIFFLLKMPILNLDSIDSKLIKFTCLLIISGILGNMLNLFFLGYVVDFIKLSSDTNEPLIFNLADLFLWASIPILLFNIVYIFIYSD